MREVLMVRFVFINVVEIMRTESVADRRRASIQRAPPNALKQTTNIKNRLGIFTVDCLTGKPESEGLPTRSTWLLALLDGVVAKILLALLSMTLGLRPIIILWGSGEFRFQRPDDELLLPRLLIS